MRIVLRLELFLFLVIICVALFFRIWKIDQYMNFLGDEGRDAIIVNNLVREGNVPFIGPPTSVGNMYLGPVYYYMMAVPMAVSGSNPISAAVMVAIFGTATVGLIYWLSKEWFGWIGAAIGAFLYAISPVAIIYARSSWNPNPVPFFTLLAFLGFYRAHKTGNFWWLVLVGGSLAVVLQLHYFALALLPTFGILWGYEITLIHRKKLARSNFWKGTIAAILLFLLIFSPLVMFDLKHDFLNYKAFGQILGKESAQNSPGFLTNIWSIYQQKLVGRYMTPGSEAASWMVSLVLLIPFIVAIYKFRKKALRWVILATGLWLVIGVAVASIYKGEIYDHYLGFLSPVPYLLFAGVVSIFIRNKVGVVIMIVGVCGLVYLNLVQSPLQYPPNRQLERTITVANFLKDEAGSQPFNFALIAERNYDDAYEFYLNKFRAPLWQIQHDNTGILYVVCENSDCRPIGNAKYEIAAFGWAVADWQKEVGGVKIFRLIPNPDQPKSAK